MTTTTTAAELAERYLRGWNEHDGAAVAACFADGGTYVDPTLPGPLPKAAIGEYVAALTAAIPDLAFVADDVVSDGRRVCAPWRMQGTWTGPMPGLPEPTGRRCDLPGIDLITVGEDGITGVVGYFDQKTFAEQLGLRVDVAAG
ncbi:ester cyclase [Geodermatophilus sp. SYSU D01119]